MKNYTVRRYSSEYFELWNAFISIAKNATFLFHRDFMEYHSDRFQDFSLLVFEGEKLMSVLPANRVGDTVFSHQGLTYGGLVLDDDYESGCQSYIANQLSISSNKVVRCLGLDDKTAGFYNKVDVLPPSAKKIAHYLIDIKNKNTDLV